jgi:hypothetical protein
MNKKKAKISFLAACVVLAVLLLVGTITPLVGGAIFAVALVLFGGLSRGFKN